MSQSQMNGKHSPNQPEPKPSMDWLREEHPLPKDSNGQGTSAEPPVSEADPALNQAPGSKRSFRNFALLLLALAAIAFLALKPQPAPKSVALEAEGGANLPASPQAVLIGEAAPLTPPARMTPNPSGDAKDRPGILNAPPSNPAKGILGAAAIESPLAGEGNPQPMVQLNLPADLPGIEGRPIAGQPGLPSPNGGGQPSPTAEPNANDPAATGINQRLEVLQALIERLERNGRVLAARVDGLELVSANAPTQANGDNPAPSGVTADPGPKPKRAKPRPAVQQPVSDPPRRTKPSRQPLPFHVESVDLWGGRKTVVILQNGQYIDAHPGERHAGWRIESADGQSVTLSDPSGAVRTVVAGEGGRP